MSSTRPRLEFFFDCSSPWTYLAFHKIEEVAERGGAELVWRPILVGGVFNSVNPSVYEQRRAPVPAKFAYYAKDLQDWAHAYGLRIGMPPVFPVNSVRAMRGVFVAERHAKLSAYVRAVFEAYWGELCDISREDVLGGVIERVGLPTEEFFAAVASPELKEKLRANTEELIARGGFGSPTMFVEEHDMYFGNDRLGLVADALDRARAQHSVAQHTEPGRSVRKV